MPLLPKRNQKDITSLIEEFEYPKLGPGMMWERCTELVEKDGGTRCVLERPGQPHRARRAAAATAVHYERRRTRTARAPSPP